MKTIIVALFASCVVSLAQTNTDSSGYVTNANLLMPFTLTNSVGDVITNAVLVKLMPNKFIYKYPPGGEGMARLVLLPKDLQEKIGYNPTNAVAAVAALNSVNAAVASNKPALGSRSGYVTNANLLTPFTLTNSAGDVITNAVLVKLMPNKFIYKTPNDGEGMMRLDSLSKDLRVKFGYNPVDAFKADVAEQTLDDAEGIEIFQTAWYDVKKHLELCQKLGLYAKLGESVYDQDPVATLIKRQKELDEAFFAGLKKKFEALGELEEARIRARETGQDPPSKIEADVQVAQARTLAKVESLQQGKAVYELKKELAISIAAQPMLEAAVKAAELEAAKFPTVAPGAK